MQLLSLFQRNPALLDRVAAVLGAAPMLADHLARYPAALEGLLAPEEAPDPARLLRARLRDARLLEDAIEIDPPRWSGRRISPSRSPRWRGGSTPTRPGGGGRRWPTRRLPRCCRACWPISPRATAGCAAAGMAVVALGKAGGREMMAGSDLDLMLIYDHPEEVTESHGARRLPASQWFVRAVHAFVAALTAPGAEGPLYAVDMRLRPSGNKGPVAVSLAAFQRYHAEDAWTWERMALTRARVVAGPPALRARVQAAIAAALAQAGEPERDPRGRRRDARADAARPAAARAVGREAAARRADRGRVHRPGAATGPRPGAPGVCSQTTRIALRRLRGAGLLAEEDAALLIRADRSGGRSRGCCASPSAGATRRDLAGGLGAQPCCARRGRRAVDLAGAAGPPWTRLAREVRAAFIRHVGEIGT